MLKFKLTIPNIGSESTKLDITDVVRVIYEHDNIKEDAVRYEILDGSMGIVNKINDEMLLNFEATNIYGIQSGSHLTGVNHIQVENGSSMKVYDYYDDLEVNTASKENNSFSVYIKKDIDLDLRSVSIEPRINIIHFVDNGWVMENVSSEWFKENVNVNEAELISTENAAVGINAFKVPFYKDEKLQYCDDNKVFYYENNKWNELNLITVGDKELEGCLVENGYLDLTSFHEYDTKDGNPLKRKIVNLTVGNIYYTMESYIVLDFNPTHYFGEIKEEYETQEDEEAGMFYTNSTDYGKLIIKSIEYPLIFISYEKINDEGFICQKTFKVNCKIDNDTTLSFNFDALIDEKTDLESLLFDGNIIRDERYWIVGQEGNDGNISVKRNNIMYDDAYASFDILLDTSLNVIKIPITQKFETDLFHQDAVKTHFVEAEQANAINPIMDLEKDVYIPAIFDGNPNGDGEYSHINSPYTECREIIFNLHFRKHRDSLNEKWKCDRDAYWNGTRTIDYGGKNIIDLDGRVYQYDEKYKDSKNDYFSYFGEIPNGDNDGYDDGVTYAINEKYKEKRDYRNKLKEYQSDTLAYLGFSNNDVKYQKSKLKKSFLRLSFYDSDNVANQNLLHTATIFLDGGNLFSKYIKNFESDDDYVVIDRIDHNGETYRAKEHISGKIYRSLGDENRKKCKIAGSPLAVTGTSLIDEEQETTYDKNGVRVNREPMRSQLDIENDDDIYKKFSNFEDLRLSSQFIVNDKYTSMKSSEGFYFYTYKNNDDGVFPSDIYMRVDFNHAGYGRTIPFMMPYIRKNEENLTEIQPGYYRYTETLRDNKIKTFDDICYDWSELDIDDNFKEKAEEDIGYGAIRFVKYSYIKLKYRYDKRTQKHIYYLDPDVYGEGATTNNGHGDKIIFNLYEGRVR